MKGAWSGKLVVITAYPDTVKPMVQKLIDGVGDTMEVILFGEGNTPSDCDDVLFLIDLANVAKAFWENGCAVVGLQHEKNVSQDFPFLPYLVTNPEEMNREDFRFLWNRVTGSPCDILETKRLYVRETTVEDVDAFYEIYKDTSITEYMENLFADPEEERAYQEMYIRNIYGLYGYGVWTVIEKSSGDIIGRAGIAPRDGFVEPELGFVIGTKWQNKGYAYEVCLAILDYARSDLGISDIIAVVHQKNIPSMKLCEKLGFTDTGEEVVKDYRKFFLSNVLTS